MSGASSDALRVCLRGVGHDFDTANDGLHTALENIEFTIEPHEFVCVVGPSGCGKSTLLRVLAGLLDPSRGGVAFEGLADGDVPRAGLVFQEHGVFPWMTVLDNVAFGLEMRGVERGRRHSEALKFIERVGLAGFANRYPHELSVGMRQRVGVARAFVSGAPMLLMDEPFGSLDPQSKWVLQEELLRIWREDRKSVVFVTHDLQEAVLLADRILVMSGSPGKIQDDIHVPLPRPRDLSPGKSTALDISGRIWHLLEDDVRKGSFGPAVSSTRSDATQVPGRRGALALAIALLAIWEVAARLGALPDMFFPAPTAIGAALWARTLDGTLPAELGATLGRAVPGLLLGGLPGLLLGLALGWSRRLRALGDPFVAAIHPIPKLALLPLFLVLVGLGEAPKLLVVAAASFFPMAINAMEGVRQINPLYFEVAAAYGAGRGRLFRRIIVPGTLPMVMAGLRIAANLALVTTIAVEMVLGGSGLGAFIWVSWQVLRVEDLYATLLVMSLLGLAMKFAITWSGDRLLPWEPGKRRAAPVRSPAAIGTLAGEGRETTSAPPPA